MTSVDRQAWNQNAVTVAVLYTSVVANPRSVVKYIQTIPLAESIAEVGRKVSSPNLKRSAPVAATGIHRTGFCLQASAVLLELRNLTTLIKSREPYTYRV